MRQMTKRGYDFVEREEALRLAAYDDATGHPVNPGDPVHGTLTIGWGHTGPDVHPGQTITREEADALFDKDTDWAEELVDRLCPGANANEYDALVDLAFNIGIRQFTTSSVVRMWKKGDKMAAGNSIGLFTKTIIGGVLQDSPGLIARRARETALFFTPPPGDVPKPIPQTVENPSKIITPGKVIAATTVAVPTANVIVQNAQPTIDAIQHTADTVKQATTAWSAVKDAFSILNNGHVMTVVCLVIAAGVGIFVAYKLIQLIRTGKLSFQ